MTPHPLDELDRLEAARRRPSSRSDWDPHTGRALPRRIPAVPRYRLRDQVLGAVYGAALGTGLYAVVHLVSGGAL